MKTKYLFIAIAIASMLTCASCSKDDSEGNAPIVGKWGSKEVAVTGIDAYLQPRVNQLVRSYFESRLPCEKNSYIEFSEDGMYTIHNLCNQDLSTSIPYTYDGKQLKRAGVISEVEAVSDTELRLFISMDVLFTEYPDLERLLIGLLPVTSAKFIEIYQRK